MGHAEHGAAGWGHPLFAGAGLGADDVPAPFQPGERTRLRQQALDWLRAELTAWHKVLQSGKDKERAAVAQAMQHWLKDDDFAGVRDAAVLKPLSEVERRRWQRLWEDVENLRKSAAAPK